MALIPKISIVTPSFNQGRFLEKTILSVLDQDYPNLEYMVIDGGSADESSAIIRKYAPRLQYFVSERDHGQADAINKGLRRISGDLWTYLCSDDTLAPGALWRYVDVFRESGADVVYGDCAFMTEDGRVSRVKRSFPFDLRRLIRNNYIWQPSTFLRRAVLERHGYLDASLQYTMDYEYWLRIAGAVKFCYVPWVFSNYRLHSESKTVGSTLKMVAEARRVKKRYGGGLRADWSYATFIVWGQYYYRIKRRFFDWQVQYKSNVR